MTALERRLATWRAELAEAAAARGRPAWLRDAYADPAAFWRVAGPALLAAAPGVPRSAVFEWYDLFHELGARHAVGTRAAHQDGAPGRGFRDESYAALTRRAQRLATAWRAKGVVPGAAVCVVMDASAAQVACLLAAFCCGAVVTLLPPDGRSFVRRALRALAESPPLPGAPPQVFVVAGTTARPWALGEERVELLDWESMPEVDTRRLLEPHRYGAAEPAARFFSPLSEEWDAPVLLDSEQLYLSALRDGLLVFGLEPGQGIAAPGFCEVQLKPGLLLAALAAGATWVELSPGELEDGRVLFEGAVAVLGVSAPLRNLLARTQLPPGARGLRWFRNAAEEGGIAAWTSFESEMQSAGALGSRYFGNSAAGGSLLFSAWTDEPSTAPLWRTPGLSCKLAEPNGTGMPALADVALLSPGAPLVNPRGAAHELPAAALGRLVIVATEHNDLWVANLGSHRRGAVLPELQMEAVLKSEVGDAVRAAVLVVMPLVGEAAQRVALLVYARPGTRVEPELVRRVLLAELGAERVPDRVEVFELNPKLLDPKKDAVTVDRGACRTEYLSGLSWRKSRCRVFAQLATVSLEAQAMREHRPEQRQQGSA